MEPEFKHGDAVVFDREAPLENGCMANFFYRREVVRPGQLSVALKRLFMAPPPFVTFPWKDHPKSEVVPVIIAEQLKPFRQFTVRCRDLLAVHRCLGRTGDPAVQETLKAAGWAC
ncbi:MAG: hypothetical protein ACR2OF_05605 [Hyphomicrobium sp.]